jgi:Carboxypeptidase regulatory-like domain
MKLLCLAPLSMVLLQVALNPLQQQKPQGSLEGSVARLGPGQPIPGARVTITRRGGPTAGAIPTAPATPGTTTAPLVTSPAGARGTPTPAPQPLAMTTDDKGKFSFQSLEDGTYTLQVQANGYVPQTYGQRYANGPGTPITVSAGQPVKDLTVSLTPAANLSGRIRDDFDQPLANVPVQLLRSTYSFDGQRTFQSAGTVQTNDRGEYRLYWVNPGRYYLLAGRPSAGTSPLGEMMMATLGGGANASGNAPPAVLGYAFYPGVAELGNARTIDLAPGADLQSVDLVVAAKPKTYSIRGKLIDSRTGQAPPRASVVATTQTPGTLEDIGEPAPTRNYNAATGMIEIRGLQPGTYSITAVVQDMTPNWRESAPRTQAIGTIPVTVASSDVEGIVINAIPGGTVTGRIRVDGQLPANMTVDRLRIQLAPVGTSAGLLQSLRSMAGGYDSSPARPGGDGVFTLNNVIPGEYRIDISGFPVAGGNAVARIGSNAFMREARFDGTDVLNSPLRFSGGSTGILDVVLAVGGGQINGTLIDVRSQPVPNSRVVIVPERGHHRFDLYRVSTTDQNGRFSLTSVPPGDYRVFSWESIEENAWFDRDLIARFEARGRTVHVTETSTETIDVRIIPAEGTP